MHTEALRWTAGLPHHAVAVVNADDELLEVPAGVCFGQPFGSADQAEEVASRRILHCDCQVVRRQEHLRNGRLSLGGVAPLGALAGRSFTPSSAVCAMQATGAWRCAR